MHVPFPLLFLWFSDRVSCLVDESLRPHDFERVVDGVELRHWRPVRVEVVVAPGEVLSVVDGEVHVVQGVVSRTIDELLSPMPGDHIAIMNEDGPDLHRDEEYHVEVAVHGAYENECAVHVSTSSDNMKSEFKSWNSLTGKATTARIRREDGKLELPMV